MVDSTRERLISWGLVGSQAALVVAAVVVPRRPAWDGPDWLDPVAWTAIGVGLALGLWSARHLGSGLTAMPMPNGAIDMVTRGPYRWIRHPLYTALVIAIAAVAIRSRTWSIIAVAVALAIVLAIKARWEERHLRATFGGYAEYSARVGRFIPGVGRVPR